MSAQQSLIDQAKDARDQIGWTNYTDAGQMAFAVIELARVVVTIAGRVQQLELELARLKADAATEQAVQ